MWRSIFPPLQWLGNYQRSWLRGDVLAGITLAAYLLPAALGDASLAGLPAEVGSMPRLFSGLVFWLFCSSRQTVVSVTSAISLLVGSTLGGLAGGDPARFQALATCTALLVAATAFLAWVVRAGAWKFISETVLIGFKSGVALDWPATAAEAIRVPGSAWRRFLGTHRRLSVHLAETNPYALAVGGAALVLLALGKLVYSLIDPSLSLLSLAQSRSLHL